MYFQKKKREIDRKRVFCSLKFCRTLILIFWSCMIFCALQICLSRVEAVFKRYVPRCPAYGVERFLQAKAVCGSTPQYHCLYDDEWKLAELCQPYKQLPSGIWMNSLQGFNPILWPSSPQLKLWKAIYVLFSTITVEIIVAHSNFYGPLVNGPLLISNPVLVMHFSSFVAV